MVRARAVSAQVYKALKRSSPQTSKTKERQPRQSEDDAKRGRATNNNDVHKRLILDSCAPNCQHKALRCPKNFVDDDNDGDDNNNDRSNDCT